MESRKENYTVYMHTTPSGKVYVGITKQNPEQRWANGNGYKRNKHFYRAILIYDWKNIKHEIVESGLTKEQACAKEIELIAKYDSTNPCKGYNNSTGGECGTLGAHLSAETRRKMSYAWKHSAACIEHLKKVCESNKGRQSPLKGRHHSAEAKKHMSDSHKGHLTSAATRIKISESNKGKKHEITDEGMAALIKAHKGKPALNRKQVVCLETNEKYSSALEAAVFIGLSKDRIAAACRGEQKTAGGYHWKYADEGEYKGTRISSETRRKISESNKGKNAKAVICIETGILYSSVTEAAESIGIAKSAIANAARGVRKTSGGYHWEYVEAQ